MAKTLREHSRTAWEPAFPNPSIEEIKLGTLLRIADSTEAMAKNHVSLIQDLEFYKRRYQEEMAAGTRLIRRNAALRGQITKLKRKLTPNTDTK